MKNIATEIRLPLPTHKTLTGPVLSYAERRLDLSWDYVDGPSRMVTKVIFRDVLSFECRSAASCGAEAVTDSGIMSEMKDSPWLRELVTNWAAHVVLTDFEIGLGGVERFRHYHVYFDDVASLDVAAASALLGDVGGV